MPYICTVTNRYIGEHSCGRYHYGDMTIVRPCCVEDCKRAADLVLLVASTPSHPAYALYRDAWDSLTDAEQKLVPDVHWRGLDGGFMAERGEK